MPLFKKLQFLNGMLLNQAFNIKHLYLYLVRNLSWKQHCDAVAVKVARGLGLIRRLKNKLPPRILVVLYHSLTNPYLSCVCFLWTSYFVSSFKRVQILQNKVVRVLGDYVRFQNSTVSCFTKLFIGKCL